MDEMLIVKAVRRGTRRALVSCDLPAGRCESVESAVRRRRRGRCGLVKLDARRNAEAVTAMVKAGIPVFARFDYSSQQGRQTFGRKVCERCESARSRRRRPPFAFGPVAGPLSSTCIRWWEEWAAARGLMDESAGTAIGYAASSQIDRSTLCEHRTNHSRRTRPIRAFELHVRSNRNGHHDH
jgi:hypothetical protein